MEDRKFLLPDDKVKIMVGKYMRCIGVVKSHEDLFGQVLVLIVGKTPLYQADYFNKKYLVRVE